MSRKPIDLTGQRFGSLLVLERASSYRRHTLYPDGTIKSYYQPRWICKCDCGNVVTVMSHNLRYGRSKSCGCQQRKGAGERIAAYNRKRKEA